MKTAPSAASPGWHLTTRGVFTLDSEPVDLAILADAEVLSVDDVAAIRRLPVGALFELDSDVHGIEAMLRRVR